MDLDRLTELDLEHIGEWSGLAKAMLILLLCGGIVGGWYAFDTKGQLQRLRTAEQEETSLRREFESKQQQSANLGAYRQQLAEMEESFGAMRRRLPDRTEVAALLVDVSQAGLAAGLEFERFQPADETRRDFCAELPIHIRVTGRFHEFGRFISGLAALPRIVTIHDIDISIRQGEQDAFGPAVPLNLKAIVKTYRYLDEETAE